MNYNCVHVLVFLFTARPLHLTDALVQNSLTLISPDWVPQDTWGFVFDCQFQCFINLSATCWRSSYSSETLSTWLYTFYLKITQKLDAFISIWGYWHSGILFSLQSPLDMWKLPLAVKECANKCGNVNVWCPCDELISHLGCIPNQNSQDMLRFPYADLRCLLLMCEAYYCSGHASYLAGQLGHLRSAQSLHISTLKLWFLGHH